MAVEHTKRAFVPQYSNEIDIESLITAPLVAASKANVVMATGQQRFLLDFCFNRKVDKDGEEIYEPVLINMVIRKGIIDQEKQEHEPGFCQQVELRFSVPLLCIVPFSSLAVEKVSIDFDMELTSASSQETTLAKDGKIIDEKAQLKGRISSSMEASSVGKSKSQSTSSLRVSLNAGPLPLSSGFLSILDLYTKTIQPTNPKPKLDE